MRYEISLNYLVDKTVTLQRPILQTERTNSARNIISLVAYPEMGVWLQCFKPRTSACDRIHTEKSNKKILQEKKDFEEVA